MRAEAQSRARTPGGGRRWAGRIVSAISILLGLALIGLFGAQVWRDRIGHVPEVDCEGYYMMAESFSRFHWPRWQEDFGRFRGHVWVTLDGKTVMAKYPPGYPLLLAVGYWIDGLPGALAVSPVMGIVGAVAFWLLACALFNTTVGFICTAIWLLSPMLLFQAGYPYSHSSEITILLLAFLFTLCWARYRWSGWALAAGACIGFAPLVRPTSVLVWPAIALMGWIILAERGRGRGRGRGPRGRAASGRIRLHIRVLQRAWRRDGGRLLGMRRGRVLRGWLGFVLAAGVPLLFLLCYNTVCFGNPLHTGYAVTGEQYAFDASVLRTHLDRLFPVRERMLANLFWVLAILGLLFRRDRRGLVGVFFLWVVPTVLLYSTYYCFAPHEAFLRFFMSSLPAVILCIGFLLTLKPLAHPLGRLALIAAFIGWTWYSPPLARQGQAAAPDLVSRLSVADAARVNDPLRHLAAFLRGQGGKVALYGHDTTHWTAASVPGVISYDLRAWNDPHYFRPYQPACRKLQVWDDPARHRRLHEWYAELGREGLWRDFLHHVEADASAGREVLVSATARDPALRQLRAAGYTLTAMPQVRSLQPLWRVSAGIGMK